MGAYSAAVAYARQSGGWQSCRGRAIMREKSNVHCHHPGIALEEAWWYPPDVAAAAFPAYDAAHRRAS
jgi:hypothetical protein